MVCTGQTISFKESGQTESTILYDTYFKVVTCEGYKNLFNFVSLSGKLQNQYCHNGHLKTDAIDIFW